MRARAAPLAALALALLAARARGLRCCVMLEAPYVVRDARNARSGYSGVAIDYLELLEDSLEGAFRCTSVTEFAARDSADQGFTGFVREMAACAVGGDSSACSCDVGVAGWSITSDRAQLADLVTPFSTDDFRMVTRVDALSSAPEKRGLFFFSAFSLDLWFAIAGLFTLIVLVFLLDRRFAPAPAPRGPPAGASRFARVRHFLLRQPLLYRARNALDHVVLHMLNQGGPGAGCARPTTRQRVLNVITLLIGVFLVVVYEASLTVQIFTDRPVSLFGSVDDLRSCKVRARAVCIPRGGGAEKFWRENLDGLACNGGEGPRFVDGFDAGFEALESRACDFFYASGGVTMATTRGRYCGRLRVVGDPFFRILTSFVLPKGSNLTAVLSDTTLKLRETDALQTVAQNTLAIDCEDVTDPTVTWDKLSAFFYAAFLLLAAMIVLMFVDPSSAAPAAPAHDDLAVDIKNDRMGACDASTSEEV